MFGKKNKKKKISRDKVETILGSGIILGDIHIKGSLRIEGKVKGSIKAEGDLFIGKNGQVSEKIVAQKVIIAGKVKGNVIATKRIEILPEGELTGDIQTKSLVVNEGAVFLGMSKPLNEKNKTIDFAEKVKKEAAAGKENRSNQ